MRADNTQVANIDMFEPLDAAGAPIDAPFTVFDPSSLVGYAAGFYLQDEWRLADSLMGGGIGVFASQYAPGRGYSLARRRKSSSPKQMPGPGCLESEGHMAKLTFISLIVVFATSLPRISGATNYSEHRKFDFSFPPERVPIARRGNLKKQRHDNWYHSWHHD